MKKSLVTIGLASIVALSSYAQGFVIFSSSTQNMLTNNTGNIVSQATASGKVQGAGNYYFALFYSTTVGSGAAISGGALSQYAFNDTADWTMVTQSYGANTATAGRFAAIAPNADNTTTVNGLAGGANANFLVVGWSANLGTNIASMELALVTPGTAGYLGQSVVSGVETAGNGTSIPAPSLFGASAPSIQAFTLGSEYVPTPEPGTLALAALGGASLFAFRRKNK
jgi:hypothetical protein